MYQKWCVILPYYVCTSVFISVFTSVLIIVSKSLTVKNGILKVCWPFGDNLSQNQATAMDVALLLMFEVLDSHSLQFSTVLPQFLSTIDTEAETDLCPWRSQRSSPAIPLNLSYWEEYVIRFNSFLSGNVTYCLLLCISKCRRWHFWHGSASPVNKTQRLNLQKV